MSFDSLYVAIIFQQVAQTTVSKCTESLQACHRVHRNSNTTLLDCVQLHFVLCFENASVQDFRTAPGQNVACQIDVVNLPHRQPLAPGV
jgi:hypothetical protein